MSTTLAGRWWAFTKERFPLPSHIPMILLFTYAHVLIAGPSGQIAIESLIILLLGVMFFFYKLRLYDEIKDFELDVKINPKRPLPRGLLKHDHLYYMILFCLVAELACFAFFGMNSIITMALAVLYSLVMFKEFFIKDIIRPHLTTYASIHTVVTVPLSLAIFSALTNKGIWEMPIEYFYYALNNWALFNVFEFGRKTFQANEERHQVESYSKIFTRFGAVALTGINAGASFYLTHLIVESELPNFKIFSGTLLSILIVVGGIYSYINQGNWGKIYRNFSSVYIILFYLGLIIFKSM